MADLNELVQYDSGVYQIETSDPVLGGPTGIANRAALALANRTAYLKKHVDDLENGTVAAGKANKLSIERSIAMIGDASWSVNFDGTGNVSSTLTLANTGVTAGTYPKVTVDAKGRVTAGAALAAADIPALDWAKITTGKPTTVAGYGITDIAATVPNASETVQGKVELATSAETVAGASTSLAVHPAGVAAALKASAATRVMQLSTGAALPAQNIGPIWHDDYNSVMTWQTFNANGAAYVGYASTLIGNLLQDTQPTPRTGYIKSGTQNLSRTTYAALRAWAMHNGLMVALGTWVAGALMVADNADGTTFRIYDVRGEFLRNWDDGRGANAGRTFGSAEAATILRSAASDTRGSDTSGTWGVGFAYAGPDQIITVNPPGALNPNGTAFVASAQDNGIAVAGNTSEMGADSYRWLSVRSRNTSLAAMVKF